MEKYQTKSCLRCEEHACEKAGFQYRCRSCGFVEEIEDEYENSIDSVQKKYNRTLDLVEIFSFANEKRSNGL